jgi:hypothetical protein
MQPYETYLIRTALEKAAEAAAEHLVFGYDTLKDPAERKKIWGSDPGAEQHVLSGHEVLDGKVGYKDLAKDKNAKAAGVLLRLTGKQLKDLDAWETRYSRSAVGRHGDKPVHAYLLRKGPKRED